MKRNKVKSVSDNAPSANIIAYVLNLETRN